MAAADGIFWTYWPAIVNDTVNDTVKANRIQ